MSRICYNSTNHCDVAVCMYVCQQSWCGRLEHTSNISRVSIGSLSLSSVDTSLTYIAIRLTERFAAGQCLCRYTDTTGRALFLLVLFLSCTTGLGFIRPSMSHRFPTDCTA